MSHRTIRLLEFDVGPGLDAPERLGNMLAEVVKRWNEEDPGMEAELLGNTGVGTDKMYIMTRHESGHARQTQWHEFFGTDWAKERTKEWQAADEKAGGRATTGFRESNFYRLDRYLEQ